MGNQTFQNHEFLAMPRENDEIGDIYEYVDVKLKFYEEDQYSNLTETHMIGTPGTYAPVPNPTLR